MANLWILLMTFLGFNNNVDNTIISNKDKSINTHKKINRSEVVAQDEIDAFYHS